MMIVYDITFEDSYSMAKVLFSRMNSLYATALNRLLKRVRNFFYLGAGFYGIQIFRWILSNFLKLLSILISYSFLNKIFCEWMER